MYGTGTWGHLVSIIYNHYYYYCIIIPTFCLYCLLMLLSVYDEMLAVQNFGTTAQVLTITFYIYPAVIFVINVFAFYIIFIVPGRYLRVPTRTLRHIPLLYISQSFKDCLSPKHVTVANTACGSSDVFRRQITLRHIWYCFWFDIIRRSD